jgi:hypothetical protein
VALRLFPLLLLGSLALACATGRSSIDDARREQLQGYWEMYRADDSRWPATRDAWYAQGGAERELLVLTLVQEMVHKALVPVRTERGLEPGWKRPQRELLSLGAEGTVPILVEALRAGRDGASLEPISVTLAGFGAIDPILDALDQPREGDSKIFPRYALEALVGAGGERALARVAAVLRSDPDWQLRAAAAVALGHARFSDQERAATALMAGLSDADPFVIDKVLDSLVIIGRQETAPRIALYLEEASARGDVAGMAMASRALRRLTGVSVKSDDPVLWKEAARQAADRGRAQDG